VVLAQATEDYQLGSDIVILVFNGLRLPFLLFTRDGLFASFLVSFGSEFPLGRQYPALPVEKRIRVKY
jgi:hypothetical protein